VARVANWTTQAFGLVGEERELMGGGGGGVVRWKCGLWTLLFNKMISAVV